MSPTEKASPTSGESESVVAMSGEATKNDGKGETCAGRLRGIAQNPRAEERKCDQERHIQESARACGRANGDAENAM